jgi:cell wall-associated NlpC family hydrolase
MPIKRLTALTVLAAAVFVVAPVQADTTKTHGKAPQPKHAPQKQSHGKVAHAKPAHSNGKLAANRKKTVHSKLAASNPVDVDTEVSTDMSDVAVVEAKPELVAVSPLQANPLQANYFAKVDSAVAGSPTWLNQAPAFNPTQMMVQSNAPTYFDSAVTVAKSTTAFTVATSNSSERNGTNQVATGAADTGNVTDLRKALISMAMGLRDIRYVRGGHDPATGFDCSGFVRYVFAHAIGMQLPTNSASQFLAGLKVKREDMKPGDLVFFHTRGKSGISHVGIYISNGNFIHSPASGQSVQISSLDEAYWAKHFAGAKRPEAMQVAMLTHNG